MWISIEFVDLFSWIKDAIAQQPSKYFIWKHSTPQPCGTSTKKMEKSLVLETKNVHALLPCGLAPEIETVNTEKWDKVVFQLK